MLIKIISIPIVDGEVENQAMNEFLLTHRIINVREEIVEGRYWSFCIRYLEGKNDTNFSQKTNSGKEKVDYREVLSVDEFGRFAVMRDIRKLIAAEKGIPTYAIFTDAELALLSREESLTLEGARKIKGIGKGHIEYVEQIINKLAEMKSDEKVQ